MLDSHKDPTCLDVDSAVSSSEESSSSDGESNRRSIGVKGFTPVIRASSP